MNILSHCLPKLWEWPCKGNAKRYT